MEALEESRDSRIIESIIPTEAKGERLDRYIGQTPDFAITRSRAQKLIKDQLITVNSQPAQRNHILKGGEKLVIKLPPPQPSEVTPENIPLDVIYEDEYLIVVNKPVGMVTHPATGNYTGTLVNALIYYSKKLSCVQGFDRPGIIHRLDKNTSGLILIAKNDDVHLHLQKQMKQRDIKRTYMAIVCGHMKEDLGEINLPIGRSLKNRKKMTVTNRKARTAITEYKLINRFRLYDLLEINLQTGRTHQIRVHFSHLGHPVLGDPDYGGRLKWHRGVFSIDKPLANKVLNMMGRQALHACRLEFTHPINGKLISLETDPPDDFKNLLEYLEKDGR